MIEIDADNYLELPGDGVLVLGQEQDTVGGKFDATQSVSGEYTQFDLWDRVLQPQEIRYQKQSEHR